MITNKELIEKCTGQCCAVCDYHDECDLFKHIYGGLLPEEMAGMIEQGGKLNIKIELSVPVNEAWLEYPADDVSAYKELLCSELDNWANSATELL